MKKKVIIRSLFGAPIGVLISLIITICISYAVGDGQFYPVAPQLEYYCGSEINAVFWQTVFSMVYGAAFGGSSVIWELENWSLTKQTAVHFTLVTLITIPMAYTMRWVDENVISWIMYLAVFIFIYFSIWLSQYLSIRARIRKINKQIEKLS